MAIILWWGAVVAVMVAAQAVAGQQEVEGGGLGRKGYKIWEVDSKFFKSDVLLSSAGYKDQLGSAEKSADIRSFPALQGLGLSMARVDVAPRGFNPPHEHACVSELMFVMQGRLLVGFVDPTHNTIYQAHVQAGDLFLFPRGLVHFQLNDHDDLPAVALSAFNSEHPSISRVAQHLFSSSSSLSCD